MSDQSENLHTSGGSVCICVCLPSTSFEQKSRVHDFVDELVALVGSKWATSIDQPFIIRGCTECTVIFDLRFCMEAKEEEPVVMRDDIIGQRLQWEGVPRVVAPAKQEDEVRCGPSMLLWETGQVYKDEDRVPPSPKSMAGDLDGNAECWAVTRKVEWTLALGEVQGEAMTTWQ